MKPSERIAEVKKEILKKHPETHKVSNFDMLALIEYLDEEWETYKPCKHEDFYNEESNDGSIAYNVCQDCGVLFLAEGTSLLR